MIPWVKCIGVFFLSLLNLFKHLFETVEASKVSIKEAMEFYKQMESKSLMNHLLSMDFVDKVKYIGDNLPEQKIEQAMVFLFISTQFFLKKYLFSDT